MPVIYRRAAIGSIPAREQGGADVGCAGTSQHQHAIATDQNPTRSVACGNHFPGRRMDGQQRGKVRLHETLRRQAVSTVPPAIASPIALYR
jgi:hypothetical protein